MNEDTKNFLKKFIQYVSDKPYILIICNFLLSTFLKSRDIIEKTLSFIFINYVLKTNGKVYNFEINVPETDEEFKEMMSHIDDSFITHEIIKVKSKNKYSYLCYVFSKSGDKSVIDQHIKIERLSMLDFVDEDTYNCYIAHVDKNNIIYYELVTPDI